MNYLDHYNRLIDRARTRLLEGYCERHHIVPKCMDGTDESTNIVRLTAREHYIAHQLLVKIYPKVSGLIYAVKAMTVKSKYHCRGNRMYGWLKEKFSKEHSKRMKGNTNNLGRKQSSEHIAKLSAVRKGSIHPWDPSKKGFTPHNKGVKGQFGWFTDGQTEKLIKITEAPIGWIRGRSCSTLGGANRIK